MTPEDRLECPGPGRSACTPRPELVFIDGQLYFSRERDQQRQRALEAEKRRLAALDEADWKEQEAAAPAVQASGKSEGRDDR